MIEKLRSLVVAHPRDHEARLVLADALMAANDPRGEFIQMQIALVSKVRPDVRENAERRVRELSKAHEAQWAKVLPPMTEYRFRAGFIEAIRCTASSFREGGAALLAQEPVQSATLTNTTADDLAALAGMESIGRLSRLVLLGSYGDDAASAFVRSPHVAKIPSLRFEGVSGGFASAVANASMRALERLSLADCSIGDAGFELLGASKTLPALTHLYLARNGISDEGVTAFASSKSMGGLQVLALGGNEEISDEGAEALAHAPFGALRVLELNGTGISGEGAASLQKSKTLKSLRRLDLRHTGVSGYKPVKRGQLTTLVGTGW